MRDDKVDKILCTMLNGLVGAAIALIVVMLLMQAYIKRLDEQAAYYQGRYGLDRATARAFVCGGHAGRVTLPEER